MSAVLKDFARSQATTNAAATATPGSLAALCLIARLHHVAADPAALRHQLGKADSEVVGTDDLLLAAQHLGLNLKT